METLSSFACLILTIFGFIALRWIKPNTKAEMKIWQQFASSQQLNFIAGEDDTDDAIITGTIYDCFLFLKSDQEVNGTIYTLISMQGQNSDTNESDRDFLRELARFGESLKLKGVIEVDSVGKRVAYKEVGIVTDTKYLRSVIKTMGRLAKICPNIVNLGGEAIPELHKIANQTEVLQNTINGILGGISEDTKQQWAADILQLWCPDCLAHYGQIWVNRPPLKKVDYLGCRKCGQSRQNFRFEGKMIVVLDGRTDIEQSQQDGQLRINWQKRRRLFDFDEIEIIQATDEDVERFAMQVGNDTDEIHKPRYEEMKCKVWANSQLSENSMRILKRMFNGLEVRQHMFNNSHLSPSGQANKSMHANC